MEPLAPPPAAANALSSLPEAVVDGCILTRLDLRDIVRTSALSSAWRHRWESLPELSLSLRHGIGTAPAIVDSVLNRYTGGRIRDFSVGVSSQFERRVEGWLINLSHRHVQFMDLRSNDGFLRIHSSIYSFNHLVTLKLNRCEIPTRTEGFAGFPLLKELELVDAHLSVKDLEAIVEGSPLLDALMLCDVYVDLNNVLEVCVIEAPNLRSLTIISVVIDGWQFGGLPRLDEATIDLDTYMYEGDFVQFLAGFAHARKLTLPTFHLPHFDDDTLQGTLPYIFVNLRSLFLGTHFCEQNSILATFFLLRNAPNLEELDITINGAQEEEIDEANTELFQNTQWTNGMGASLQVVTINDISCLSNEMCFIELVLSKATMLRTMSITLDDESSRFDEDVLNELKAYKRASPHAQILLQKDPNLTRYLTVNRLRSAGVAYQAALSKIQHADKVVVLEYSSDSDTTPDYCSDSSEYEFDYGSDLSEEDH